VACNSPIVVARGRFVKHRAAASHPRSASNLIRPNKEELTKYRALQATRRLSARFTRQSDQAGRDS